MIDLQANHWITVGLKNSGKTNFTKWLLSQYPRHMVYDPKDEYRDDWGWNQYVPQQNSRQEVELFLDRLVYPNRQHLDIAVLDDFNRAHNSSGNHDLSGRLAWLVDEGTSHSDVGAGFMSRRISQLHPDIVGLADYIFIHRLPGASDARRMRDINGDLPDIVRGLEDYQIAMVGPMRDIQVLGPPPLMQNEKGGQLEHGQTAGS